MTDTIEDLEQHACDAYIDTMSGTAFRETLYNTLAILELARQVRRIADSLERKPQAQAKDCPFDSAAEYGEYEPQPVKRCYPPIPSRGFIGRLREELGISGGAGYDSDPGAFDPMEPDYEALAADEPTSQIQDSRDSAGFPNP